MYCKHCGKMIADDSKFCQHCGGKQDTHDSVLADSGDNNTTNKIEMEQKVKEWRERLHERISHLHIDLVED